MTAFKNGHRRSEQSSPHRAESHVELNQGRVWGQVSPAPEGFYFQASGSLVTLTAAGYNYNMDWTPFVGGTSTR